MRIWPFDNLSCTACGACVTACPRNIIELRKKNKKDPSSDELDFTGFENVMSAMVTEMGTYLKEGIEKGK